MKNEELKDDLILKLEKDLLEKHGPLMHNEDLRAALGYPTMEAFRQALSKNLVPIPVFPIEKRRGKFALVKDVAVWLAEQRQGAVNNNAEEAHMS